MAKGYWIVSLEVNDPTQYGEYVKLVRPFLAEQGARFLVRGGTFEQMEGSNRPRNIVIEFPSYAEALAAYRSDRYQVMVAVRAPAAEANFIVAEGLED